MIFFSPNTIAFIYCSLNEVVTYYELLDSPVLRRADSQYSKQSWCWMQACGTTMAITIKACILHDRTDCHCVIHVWRILNGCFDSSVSSSVQLSILQSVPCPWVGAMCVAAVLRAVWTKLAPLARLVWQEVISAPGRLCNDGLVHPPPGTISTTLNWFTHTHTNTKMSFLPRFVN